jgi:hypothetical protein
VATAIGKLQLRATLVVEHNFLCPAKIV